MRESPVTGRPSVAISSDKFALPISPAFKNDEFSMKNAEFCSKSSDNFGVFLNLTVIIRLRGKEAFMFKQPHRILSDQTRFRASNYKVIQPCFNIIHRLSGAILHYLCSHSEFSESKCGSLSFSYDVLGIHATTQRTHRMTPHL